MGRIRTMDSTVNRSQTNAMKSGPTASTNAEGRRLATNPKTTEAAQRPCSQGRDAVAMKLREGDQRRGAQP
jgi:hypothetical protein